MIERRRFSRIVYQAPAKLSQGDLNMVAYVNDLSLRGLLLTVTDADLLSEKSILNVEFTLPESDITIQLNGTIVNLDGHTLRMSIEYIDIDSIAHIKRLVELNVGDSQLLYREIEHLSDLGDYR